MSAQMERVSVIIPTYNRAYIIGSAIESVLNQTYTNVEVIVVDDGSTDNTKEVLSQYGNRVKYIYQENAGPAAARNNGIQNSQGQFIALLDSDDFFLPEKLSKQVELLRTHPDIDIALCGWQDTKHDGVTIGNVYTTLPVDKILESILLMGTWGLFPPNITLFRRECFFEVGGFDLSLPAREEQDFWLRLALTGHKFGMVEEVLCVFRSTPNSRGKNITNVEKTMPIILEKVFRHPDVPDQVVALKSEIYARVYLQLSLEYFCRSDAESSPQFKIAHDYMTKTLNLNPSVEAWHDDVFDLVPHQAIELAGKGDPVKYMERILDSLFDPSLRPKWLWTEMMSRLHTILAFRAYENHHASEIRWHVYHAIRLKPSLLKNRGMSSIFLKSLLGKTAPTEAHH